MGRSRSKWWPRVKRAWRRHRARVKRQRAAEQRKTRKAKPTGIPLEVTPSAKGDGVIVRMTTWMHDFTAAPWDSDYVALGEVGHRQKARRLDRRHVYRCEAHLPPRRFASVADLNQHLLEDHPEPTRHPRGTESRPTRPRRRMPAPTRPPNGRPAGARKPLPQTADEAAALDTKMSLIKKYIDKIQKEAVHNMGADAASNTLGDIGSMPIQTVSQIREAMVALEAIGNALEEAVTGFQQNARRSEQAPVKEEVLVHLTPAVDAAQQIANAVTTFISAFDDEYGPDIRDAKAGERMDNTALTN